MSSDSPTTPSELPRRIAELLERMDREGPEAVDALCAAHPQFATAIRQRIALLQGMGLLTAGPPQPGTFPERLGNFRLVECLGGGGMGVVYLAVQEPLGRQVALKVIRPENLYFPGARQRFQREAEAVARLQHPGIVPLYTAGEEKGVPYFAMEYVRGASLDLVRQRLCHRDPATLTGEDLRHAIDPDRPAHAAGSGTEAAVGFGRTWVGACLRIALAVAEALAHAHARGVLHRDVKPSNIMLTPDGRVLLLDFGLAELTGSTRLTRTGSQLGSLSYMAPEQVRGDTAAIDERTDVYALGVTLYELLASRPPFRERPGPTVQQQILEGRPQPLRNHNRAVPWDVETVCLTAMERTRARRYGSAQAFGDDLRRLIELRPITARRPGIALRARRFVQRRPATSVALALGALLLVGGPLAFGLVEHFASLEIQRALDGERREKLRAHANLERSFRALDQLILHLSADRLARFPGMTEVRRDLLTDALRIYEDILAGQSDEPEARMRAADMARRVGTVQWQLGELPLALRALDQSLALLATSLAADPRDTSARVSQASSQRTKALVLAGRGELAAAEALWRTALATLAQVASERPDDAYLQSVFGQSHADFAAVLEDLGQSAQAEASLLRAVAILDHEAERWPQDREVGLRLANVLASLGATQLARHHPADAKLPLARALALLERWRPAAGGDGRELAAVLGNLGLACLEEHDHAHAEEHLGRALALVRDLVRDFPREPSHEYSLSQILVYLGTALREAGRTDAAGPRLGEAVAILRGLVRAHPDAPDYLAALANALGEHADTCLLDHRVAAAQEAYTESQHALERLVADNPHAERHHVNLAYTLGQQAEIASQAGAFAGARALAERALSELSAARRITPDNPNHDQLTDTAAARLGDALFRLGDHAALARLADELAALPRDTGGFAFRGGWLRTLAATLVADDPDLPAADREALLGQHLDAALTLLTRAQELGHPGLAAFLRSSEGRVLRRSPRFAPLVRRT